VGIGTGLLSIPSVDQYVYMWVNCGKMADWI